MKLNCIHLLNTKYLAMLFLIKRRYKSSTFSCFVCSASTDLTICLYCKRVFCNKDMCTDKKVSVSVNEGKFNLKCLRQSTQMCDNSNICIDKDHNRQLLIHPLFTRIPPTLKGLPNLGNTCYINSLMQVLINITHLRRILLVNPSCNNKLCLFCNAKHLLEWYITGKKEALPLFIASIMHSNKEYRNSDQHDVYMLFLHLVDMKCLKDFSDPFRIEGYNILKCISCKNKKSKSKDSLFSLSLDFSNSIQTSMMNYFVREELSDLIYCAFCNKRTPFQKYFRLKNTSEILVLHLKRFKPGNIGYTKIEDDIDIPKNISIKNKEYDLFGFVIHTGGMNYGHYVSCIIKESKCYLFDDDRVSVVDVDEHLKRAYLVFFILNA